MARAMDWDRAAARDRLRDGSYDDPRKVAKITKGSLVATAAQMHYMRSLAESTGMDLPPGELTRAGASRWIAKARAVNALKGRGS